MSNMLWISLLSAACLAAHGAYVRRLGHPGVVHAAVWLVISLGYAAYQPDLDDISTVTLGALAIGILSFSIGIHAGGRIRGVTLPTAISVRREFRRLPAAIVLISSIGLTLMLVRAFEYMPYESGMSWAKWYVELRAAALTKAKGSFGLGSYALFFCFAGTVYLLLLSKRDQLNPWLWPCLALAAAFSVLQTGRTSIVLLGCLIYAAAMPISKRVRLLVFGLAPLLIFAATLLGGRLDLSSTDAFQSSFDRHAKMYALAPVSIFDYQVKADEQHTLGRMTFRTPLAVLRTLGAPVEVPELIRPWAPTRVPGNVYTVFSPYYLDFGVIGIGVFMLLLGTLHGWIFGQLGSGSPMVVTANAALFYALLMQFFQDQYFSLMSQWVQVMFWIYVFNRLRPLPLFSAVAGRKDNDAPMSAVRA